jgi:hypothetical protein
MPVGLLATWKVASPATADEELERLEWRCLGASFSGESEHEYRYRGSCEQDGLRWG